MPAQTGSERIEDRRIQSHSGIWRPFEVKWKPAAALRIAGLVRIDPIAGRPPSCELRRWRARRRDENLLPFIGSNRLGSVGPLAHRPELDSFLGLKIGIFWGGERTSDTLSGRERNWLQV